MKPAWRPAAPGLSDALLSAALRAQDEGVLIAREMLLEFMDEVVGAYIMPQLGKYQTALTLLEPLGYGTPAP